MVMPVNCVLFDIFFCFHKAISFCICFREGLFLSVLAVWHGGPHFECVSWCPCPKCMGNLLHLQEIKWAFLHMSISSFHCSFAYCCFITKTAIFPFSHAVNEHTALALQRGGGNSTLLFLHSSLIFLYSYYFDATWIHI